jgi:CDP-6-deoxy-D-xylo-4-hexulose-3-dehydrase
VGPDEAVKYPNVDHIHFYGFYIGNYPELEEQQIRWLCQTLNDVAAGTD